MKLIKITFLLSFLILNTGCDITISVDEDDNELVEGTPPTDETPPTTPTAPTGGNTPTDNKNNSMGMGLTGIADWSTAFPIIDLMKQSRVWKNWQDSSDTRPFNVDENDWILSLEEGQTAATVFLTGKKDARPFTNVVVFYEGEGELEFGWSARKVSTDDGRYLVSVKDGNHLLTIKKTNVDNPIRNIRIIPEPYVEAYQAGEIFNPDWLAYVDQFKAFRFMDWMLTNHSKQETWDQRPEADDRSWATHGTPLEIMIQLANKVGVEPWFNIPHLADENYIKQFARIVKEQLSPSLKVYIEHSNEVWNWGFQQAQYANTAGRALFGDVGNAYMQWHGMRTAQVCDEFKLGAFSDSTERVKCVLGVQTGYYGLATGALECPLWVEKGNHPCYQHGIDYIGITTYFSAGINGPTGWNDDPEHEPTLRKWISEGDSGLDKAFEQLLHGTELSHLEEYKDFKGVADKLSKKMDYWSGVADAHGLGLVAYEGGQHITANGIELDNDPELVDFHIAINRDPRMKDVYKSIMDAWKDGGGELHMHFVDFGTPGRYGSWGNLENLNQTSSPRWDAITEFNQGVECWWLNCSE